MTQSQIDLTGMEVFWQAYGLLTQDEEPGKDIWESLLAAPGYRALTEGEFPRDFFPRMFRLAYLPSKARERESYHDKFGFLAHYLAVQAQQQELHRRQLWLQTECQWLNEAEQRVRTILPGGIQAPPPQVACVIFLNDARGYQPIVLDLLATLQLGDFLPLFVAHEFHHHYRRAILQVDWSRTPAEARELARVLEQVHAEALADQLDKPALLASGHPFVRGYREGVEKAADYLSLLQETLEGVAQGKLSLAQAGSGLNKELPMSGHYPGAFMFNKMVDACGLEAVLDTTADPFAWFRLWFQVFAPQSPALAVLNNLEEQVAC